MRRDNGHQFVCVFGVCHPKRKQRIVISRLVSGGRNTER